MGLHKDGSRVGSAGFLKAEKRDKTSTLTMTVKNLPHSIEGRFPVRYCLGTACGGQMTKTDGADSERQMSGTDSADAVEQTDRANWKEEDGITLHDGGGIWEKKEVEASESICVQILLPNGYLVEGKSKAALAQAAKKNEARAAQPAISVAHEPASAQRDNPAAAPDGSAPAQRDIPAAVPNESAPAQREDSAKPPRSDFAAESIAAAAPNEPVSARRDDPAGAAIEPVPVQRNIPDAAPRPVTPKRPPLMADALAIEGLKEDKWEQILDTYDQIHPYGDDRVFVKIAPKDFIILSANCQHLVNNSFLLHGFYNYRYVILGRGENPFHEASQGGTAISSAEAEEYFLGVPGVFYEREKMVALMFGFETFECEGGNPKPGDFGYYLRKVEL